MSTVALENSGRLEEQHDPKELEAYHISEKTSCATSVNVCNRWCNYSRHLLDV